MTKSGIMEYTNGLVTCRFLSKEEREQYLVMPVGVTQTADMIRWVAENDEERQIIEQTAYGMSRIRIKKS